MGHHMKGGLAALEGVKVQFLEQAATEMGGSAAWLVLTAPQGIRKVQV